MGGGRLPAADGEFEELGCAAARHRETHSNKCIRIGGWDCARSRRTDRGIDVRILLLLLTCA